MHFEFANSLLNAQSYPAAAEAFDNFVRTYPLHDQTPEALYKLSMAFALQGKFPEARQVQESLTRLMKGRTTIVIAHRLSTVVDADRIYVLERGQVVQSGSHAELMTADGLYANLYRHNLEEAR